MGTLEDAMVSILGEQINKTKCTPELLVNEVPKDKAQTLAHTLRHLLLQHREQRLFLKRKVCCEEFTLVRNKCMSLSRLLACQVFVSTYAPKIPLLASIDACNVNIACCVQNK